MLERMFLGPIQACRSQGQVIERYIEHRLVAVALWLPLKLVPLPLSALIRSGIALAPFQIGPAAALRMLRVEKRCEKAIAEVADEKSGYLWIIGVDPDQCGTGVGRLMMKDVLRAMSSQGFSNCLLKTENVKNVSFYSSLGFNTEAKVRGSMGGLCSWVMRRSIDTA